MIAPRTCSVAAILVLSILAEPAGAQSRGVMLVGRVVGLDGAPAPLAAVTVTALDDQSAKVELTDGDGRFRVVMEHRAATYALSVRLRGFASQSRPVTVGSADSVVVVPEFRLTRSVQDLPTVQVVSRRPPPVRDQGRIWPKPGESATLLSSTGGFSSAVTGDLTGDVSLALGAIPGVTVTPTADGSLSFSLAGLGADQNRSTVNSADGSVAPPREGGVLRVSTEGYDPTVAMSGVRADWVMLGANYLTTRRFRLTMDARPVRRATPVAGAIGGSATAPTTLSGVLAGPLPGGTRRFLPRFFTSAFDVSRRVSDVATLASLDPSALDALGVDAQSVQRVLAARTALGIPIVRDGTIDQRSTTAKLMTRLDFTRGALGSLDGGPVGQVIAQERGDQEHVFYVLLGGSTSRNSGSLVGPLTLPSYGADASATALNAQAFLSVFPRESVVNETRLSVAADRSSFGPTSLLPAASVLVSPAAEVLNGITTLQAGGIGGSTSRSRYSTVQLTNETQWTSVERRHQWKLGVEALIDRMSTSQSASTGQFEFSSSDDFVASHPAAFSRTVSGMNTVARGAHFALGIGDLYEPSKAFSFQYGVRVESHSIQGTTGENPAIESRFGARTGSVPTTVSISPMAGFTWLYGERSAGGWPLRHHSLVGGIRDYRGALRTRGAQGILGESGVAGSATLLRCVGNAAPIPDWRSYSSVASLPDECADGATASPLAQSAIPVSVYSADYHQSHAWRADLAWNNRLASRLTAVLHGRIALNSAQPSRFDLNFAGQPRFSLAAEQGRPVFVSPASFDVASGVASAVESRRDAAYARVTELRSDLRSRHASITASLAFNPIFWPTSSGIRLPFTIAYTLSDGREQTNGFIGTTAADPRVKEWQSQSGSRHAFMLGTAFHVPDWARLTAGLQVRSGFRYTPVVLGDVNGDGASYNDRAFVPDPRTSMDGPLARGISTLLASAPAPAARCLREQLGTIARGNSCVAPWAATLNAFITVDPARVGLRNRGRLHIQLINVAAAVDQMIHGAQNSRGWGQSAFPDPVLLRIKGFDPASRSVRYEVNRSFGDPRLNRSLFESTFQVGVDVSLDVGPNRERAAILARVTPDGVASRIRLDSAQVAMEFQTHRARLLDAIVNQASVLELTEHQRISLDSLSQLYEAARDSIYRSLAGYLASRSGADRDAQRRWHDANVAVAWRMWETGMAVRSVLNDRQWAKLFDGVSLFSSGPFAMERRELARMLSAWQTHPY